MTELDLEDKLLIGILRRKMKAGYDTAALVLLVSQLCGVLEKSLKKDE